MPQVLLKSNAGRFWRGNLHCHSKRSDGLRCPEEVTAAYRDAGYDFIVLSDHFEARYGWEITDTSHLRSPDFTTIIGAELSSGRWEERHTYWVTAVGLPLEMEAPEPGDHAGAISRTAQLGAFVVMLHPGLNNLPLAAVDTLPALNSVHAVEIYNHNLAAASGPDQAIGMYMLDGLLEKGHRLLVNAGDDAHFGHPRDRLGGWVEVHCERLDPDALVQSLKSGTYYSTQGLALRKLELEGTNLQVETSEAYAIALSGGGDRWQSTTHRVGEDGSVTNAEFDVTPFRQSYCRVTVVDGSGRRAWSNPIWPQ